MVTTLPNVPEWSRREWKPFFSGVLTIRHDKMATG
jgi:hypothetical protein